MKLKYSILLLGMFVHLNAHAQYSRNRGLNRHVGDSLPAFVQHYMDSIGSYKNRADSVSPDSPRRSAHALADGRFAKLFLPATFYHDIAQKKFAIGAAQNVPGSLGEQIDKALLHVYFSRPDLVLGTQTRLDNIGPLLTDSKNPVATRPDIVAKMSPTPDEAAVETVNLIVKRPNFWKFNGDYYLQFLQNFISGNWYRGGESSFSMLGSLTLQANYNNKQKVKWENKLEMKLGFQTTKSDTLHRIKTNNDQLRYTGKLGLQASKRWYYTFQLIAYTQFMRGYNSNSTDVHSDFASPLNITPSIGMDYTMNFFKGRFTGTVHLAPLSMNYLYVGRRNLAGRYGIEEGHRHKLDYGSEVNIDFNWKMASMINWKSRLYGFTSYKRALVEWENTFTFQFNKYISSNLYVFPRLDNSRKRDDNHGYWEFKEYLSFGISYAF